MRSASLTLFLAVASILLAACGGDPSPESDCQRAKDSICRQACVCGAADDECEVTLGLAGVIYADEAECRTDSQFMNCSVAAEANVDYAACADAVAADMRCFDGAAVVPDECQP